MQFSRIKDCINQNKWHSKIQIRSSNLWHGSSDCALWTNFQLNWWRFSFCYALLIQFKLKLIRGGDRSLWSVSALFANVKTCINNNDQEVQHFLNHKMIFFLSENQILLLWCHENVSVWRILCKINSARLYIILRICSGPGCSKLTTSLVNVSLKFQTLISEIIQHFCWKMWEANAKASLIFSTKISVYLVIKS